MAHRIIAMREQLHDLLTNEFKTPGKWDHIIDQIGMFSCVSSPLLLPTLREVLTRKENLFVTIKQVHGSQRRTMQSSRRKSAHLPNSKRADLNGGAQLA
jgi:aspartate/tyrosine/aromatic aminotransferase